MQSIGFARLSEKYVNTRLTSSDNGKILSMSGFPRKLSCCFRVAVEAAQALRNPAASTGGSCSPEHSSGLEEQCTAVNPRLSCGTQRSKTRSSM